MGWGWSLDTWNNVLLAALALGAISAVTGVWATKVIIELQKQEAQAAKDDLERYKSGQAAKTASLEAEAANAKLETEKLKSVVQWRSFSAAEAAALTQVLAATPGSVNLRYMDGDPEALFLAIQISQILEKAGWKIAPGAVKPAGAIVFGFALPTSGSADANNLRAAFTLVKIPFSTAPLPQAGVSFNVSTIPSAPELMVGSRAPVVP